MNNLFLENNRLKNELELYKKNAQILKYELYEKIKENDNLNAEVKEIRRRLNILEQEEPEIINLQLLLHTC